MWLGITQSTYFLSGILFFFAARSRREWQMKSATILAYSGVIVHLAYIIHRGVTARRMPLTNTYETLILFSLLMMVACLLAHRRYVLPALGGFAGLISALILAACSLMSSEIEPLLPSLRSNWLLFHVLASFLGYTAFGLAFASATAYLFLDLGSGWGSAGRAREQIGEKLNFLDWFTYRTIALGFPLLTLGIVTGAIWANTCWGSYWNWDPKETWSFITWFLYAACMHMRFTGMRGRPAAVLAFIGFGCVVFTYIGVNYWLAGLHDYA